MRGASLHRSRTYTTSVRRRRYFPPYVGIFAYMLNSPLEIVHVSRAAVPPGAVYIANLPGKLLARDTPPGGQKLFRRLSYAPNQDPGSPLSGNIVSAKCCSRNALGLPGPSYDYLQKYVVDDIDDASVRFLRK